MVTIMWIFWRHLAWIFWGSPTVIVEAGYGGRHVMHPVSIIAGVPILRHGKSAILLNPDGTTVGGEKWSNLIGKVTFQ